MRITCPYCDAAYDVPADRLPPGRTVKCARCMATWAPVATEDASPPIPVPPEPPPAPAPPPPAPPPPAEPEPPAVPEPVPAEEPEPPPPPEPAPPQAPEPAIPAAPPTAAPPTTAATAAPGVHPDLRLAATPVDSAGRQETMVIATLWLLTALTLSATGLMVFTKRTEIMHAWPASQRFYSLFGLH